MPHGGANLVIEKGALASCTDLVIQISGSQVGRDFAPQGDILDCHD